MINLHHGDCMEAMAKMPDNAYDLAIVDPPYGIGVCNMTLGNGKKKINRGLNNWDISAPNKQYFNELFRVSKNQIIWGANNMTDNIPVSTGWLFWDKGTGANDFADGELAWTSFGGAVRKYFKVWVGNSAKDGLCRIHPTQKPIALYKWLLDKYAKPGDKILDTHGGSMSIAIACHDCGYDLDLWEIDEGYYNAGVKRYNDHIKQLTLAF